MTKINNTIRKTDCFMYKYKYIGAFVNPQELWRKTDPIRTHRLERTVEIPHVTFVYHPEDVDETLFGIEMEIFITGYGCDGQNEGVKVRVACGRKELAGLIEAIAVPHITLSLAEEAEAVNTRNLQFEPVAPFAIRGTFGAVTEDCGMVVLKEPENDRENGRG